MPISIEWGTRVISIPQLYLEHDSGTLYKLDTEQFRLDLKSLEDDEEGMPFPDTHRHNTEVTVAGVTYARTIEIINGYSITFGDGQYTVILEGSNNNFFDVANGILNQNQVQIIAQNAAGLIVHTSGSGVTQQDIDDIDGVWEEEEADHSTQGTYGAELATKADIQASSSTEQSSAISGSVIDGSQDSGTFASTATRDNAYWEIGEDDDDGLVAEATFNLLSTTHRPGAISLFGRYIGTPQVTHYIELWVWNSETSVFELLKEEFMPGGNTSDATYTNQYYERHIDRGNNNEIKIRLVHHTTTYNDSHSLFIDYLEASSIEVITAEDIADAVWLHTDPAFLLKVIKNKKSLVKTGDVWELIIYDDDNATPILQKDLKDKDGNDITDLEAGTLAEELKTSV